jgi:hypothetical protein
LNTSTPRYLIIGLLSLFAIGCASSATTPSTARAFTLSDPRGDDHGDGTIVYPMNEEMKPGELDIVSLTVTPVAGGTSFTAEFARTVRKPWARTIDSIGTTLDTIARFGFYTMNVDIYIDIDRVDGSGATSTLPGRKVSIDPAHAWDKMICLTPEPTLAKDQLRRLLMREASAQMDLARGEAPTRDERRARTRDLKDDLRASVDESTYFPTDIRVAANRVEFFVPASFMPPASENWSYVVVVSGADIIERFDTSASFTNLRDRKYALMILPVRSGRPLWIFGTDREQSADWLPPVIDIIVPAGADQKQILSDFDKDNVPVLRGVVPGER